MTTLRQAERRIVAAIREERAKIMRKVRRERIATKRAYLVVA